MNKIEQLTPEQVAHMAVVRDRWLARAATGQYDTDQAECLVKFCYELAGLDIPKIIHCDSPLSARLTIAILKSGKLPASVRASVGASVWASVWDSVGDSVGASVWASVRASVRDSVGDSVGASVWASVGDSVGASVRDSVGDSVGASVWASVRASVWASVGASVGAITPDYYANFSDYGWTAFFVYFQEIGVQVPTKFKTWSTLLHGSGVFETYSFKGMCFVVKPPTTLYRNEDGVIHNASGPAILFSDGFAVYAINGRRLPSWIWEQRDSITRETFLKEKNAEIRAGMYAVLGQQRVFELLDAHEVIRKFANNETYILYRTKEEIGGKYYQWVGVTCPSTGTKYLLGVHSKFNCPIEAVASTFGLTAEEYIINQHT